MKKISLTLLLSFLTLSMFAQKKEVKEAEKALKKGLINEAEAIIGQACKLKDQADDKTKAKIFYVKANIYRVKAKKTGALEDYKKAVNVYEKEIEFEKQTGINKYAAKSQDSLKALYPEIMNKINPYVQNKDYKTALAFMELGYQIEPTDDNLYTFTLLQLYAGKNEEAYKNLKKLYDSGYTGVHDVYYVTEKKTGKEIPVSDKTQQKLLLASGEYINPRTDKTKSRRPEIITNMLYALNQLGRDDEAYQVIQQAKKEDPNNVDLIVGEANYYLKKGEKEKFIQAMKKALELDPKNANYAYNIGVTYLNLKNYDEAEKYFQKTLELDSKNKNALYGMILVKLAPEKELVDKMNNEMNPKKWDALKEQLNDVYRQALPYLEKYYQEDPNEITVVRTLRKIYNELDMKDKYKAINEHYKQLKAQQ